MLWVLFNPVLLKGLLVFEVGDVGHRRQVMFKLHLDALQVLVVKDKELQPLNSHLRDGVSIFPAAGLTHGLANVCDAGVIHLV
jgi:hypothetical protein